MTSNPSRQTRMAASADAALSTPDTSKSSQTLMDRWIEPPLRTAVPSFMDEPQRGIERHGVLQTMAPLGTPPSLKIKKAAKAEEPRKQLHLVVKGDASTSATPPPRQAVTPEPVANPSRRRSESRKIEDEEYTPKTPHAQTSHRKSLSMRSSIPRQSLPPQPSPSMSASPSKQERSLLAMDRVIQAAVEEALTKTRVHTAYALRTLYNDHRSNPRIVNLIDNIFRSRADVKQIEEFHSLMRYKKKQGREGVAKKWFEDNDNTFAAPNIFSSSWTLHSSPNKRPATESPRNHVSKSPHKETPGHVAKKRRANGYHSDHDDVAPEVNGVANGKMSNGSRSRSRSHSSTSSLSSVDEELLNLSPANLERSRAAAKASSYLGTGELQASPIPAATQGSRNNQPQPMTLDSTPGQKLQASSTSKKPTTCSTTSTATPTTQTPAHLANNGNAPRNNNMPAAYEEPAVFPQPQPSSHPVHKSLKKSAASTPQPRDEDKEERIRNLKREAKAVTENKRDIKESFDRSHVERRIEPESDADSVGPTTRGTKSGTTLRLRNGIASRRVNDEVDDLSSPTLSSFRGELGPSSAMNSRAGTPNALNRQSRRAKGGSGLRTKTSPMKKKTGPSAGLPRASGERNSPSGNGAFPHNQDENDDYCSSCGGNGDLVCCDGCTRSFHFNCVDLPQRDGQLPDSWYCNACTAVRNPRMTDDYGAFGALLAIIEKKNPSAFHLPKDVREYFEGVRTGSEGEYDDGPVVTKPIKRGAGYEEALDYLKLKDAKGNFILCHRCNGGAAGGKPIIPCSLCGLHWHLDCLDPPLSNPPPQGRPWHCPCHVDDLLAKVPAALGPAHRFRKIKNASVIRPNIRRGTRNMGHIEIDLDDSIHETDEGFFLKKEYGRVYMLPEEGIKLDFLSRVRESKTACKPPTPTPSSVVTPVSHRAAHSIAEQQAALNLTQLAFASQIADSAAPDTQILIDALITQAPAEIIDLIARADATELASEGDTFTLHKPQNRQALLAMKAMIEASLEKIDHDHEPEERVAKKLKTSQSPQDGEQDETMLL